uniref:ABC transporter ATP-binding protein n=1 Tax=Dictyoglomus thermophilum TaxID=14 RepID=A0A7C3MI77_DICTH
MTAINIINLKKSFDDKKVLNGIFLKVEEGEKIVIKGPNGCGKTTLLKIIAGLIKPDEGIVEIGPGIKISFMFQNPIFLPWLNMEENLNLTCKDPVKLKELIDYFKLKNYLNLFPQQLSGGYLQIFSFVRTLTIPHNLLLLDEPFKSLDINLKEKAKAFLKYHLDNNKKTTLLMVSHQEDREDREIADKIFNLF